MAAAPSLRLGDGQPIGTPDPYKPSAWEILDGVLGGRTITEAASAARQRKMSFAIQQQQLDQGRSDFALQQQIGRLMLGLGGPTNAPTVQPDPQLDSALSDLGITPSRSAPVQTPSRPAPGLRQLLAYSALRGGHPDQAATIIRPDVKFGPDNISYDANDPASIGKTAVAVTPEKVVDYSTGAPRISNAAGAVESAAALAGAVTGAQEGAKADYDVITVPTADGGTRSIPRSLFISAQKAGILASGIGVGQGTGARAYAQAAGTGAGGAPYDLAQIPVVGPDGRPTGEMQTVSRAAALGAGARSQSASDATYATTTAKSAADRYQTYVSAADKASDQIAKLDQLGSLLKGVEGGSITARGTEVSNALNQLGLHVDPKLGNKQAAAALSSQLILGAAGGSLGAGFSDADRRFIEATQPGVAQSSQGRQQLIDMGKAVAKRQQSTRDFAQKWVDRFGRIDARDANGLTFEQQLTRYAQANPLFGKR